MRSQRLLQNMHKVFSHDLPNQMVALQSLLQLLKTDEAASLTEDGREYVRRLHNATQRASDMVRFLKKMGRIDSIVVRTEKITLPTLAREVQGELRHQHPKIEFAFEWQWSDSPVVGDVWAMVQGIVELVGCYLRGKTGRCLVSATARTLLGAEEFLFFVEDSTAPAEGVSPHCVRWTQQALEQRMEIILAREWLALTDASLSITLPGGGGLRFSIVVPTH